MSQDSGPIAVVKEKTIPAGVDELWRHLTEGKLLSEWFADTEGLRPEVEFVFNFGDGDFFSGRVIGWDAPNSLHLRWRFMDVGPTYDIQYSLRPIGESTLLTLRDVGALSPEEAAGLDQGWEDFLMRLVSRIQTKESTRYRWSETIGATAFLGKEASLGTDTFKDNAWWLANFPEARVSLESAPPNTVSVTVRDEAWGAVATTVTITVRRVQSGVCAEVVHDGWTRIKNSQQIAQRRRYAQLWVQALRRLEQNAGQSKIKLPLTVQAENASRVI